MAWESAPAAPCFPVSSLSRVTGVVERAELSGLVPARGISRPAPQAHGQSRYRAAEWNMENEEGGTHASSGTGNDGGRSVRGGLLALHVLDEVPTVGSFVLAFSPGDPHQEG